MEILKMSLKERKRMVVMAEVKAKKMSVREAAVIMGMGYRQAKRVWQRYRELGEAGLVHRARGKPGVRRRAEAERAQILARFGVRYLDFGPTLAAEYLRKDGLKVNHETLRRWLLEEGLRTVRRRGQQHRQWRERRACFGELVQLDGSHHDWFEGRRGKAVLMVMVDDATNRTHAHFFEEETTRASYDTLEGWVRHWGLPQALYVDRDSIYRCERLATVSEQVAAQEPQTQFGRAMKQLGVDLILAHSPQAKGRVERRNGLLQDRLVKALRLEGIEDLGAANAYLGRQFLNQLNRQFVVPAASPADVHGASPRNLDAVLSWEESRVVQRDWTVAWRGRWFQICRSHEARSLAGKSIIVRELRSGKVQLSHRGETLRWRELPARPEAPAKAPVALAQSIASVPLAHHPWRQFGAATGRAYWEREQASAAPPRPAAGSSVRSSLRSDLTASPAAGRKQPPKPNP